MTDFFNELNVGSLSAGERLYYNPTYTPAAQLVTLSFSSRANEPEQPKRPYRHSPETESRFTQQSEATNTRKAKRVTDKRLAAAEREREKQQHAAEKEKTRAYREKLRLEERDAIEARKLQRKLDAQKPLREKVGKDANRCTLPAGKFKPVIGEPNKNGETPVRIDAKTVIYVKPGKDIKQVIKKYRDHFNQQK